MPLTLEPSAGSALASPELAVSDAPKAPEADPWIFRDGRTPLSGQTILRAISQAFSSSAQDAVANALIQAGELEAGISDAGLPVAPEAASLTDALASVLCTGEPWAFQEARSRSETLRVPDQVMVSPPEGFTYYALHPLDFQSAAAKLPSESKSFAVIGIRSIGTTLSAVVVAALKQQGRPASRITVRPTGHPYSRCMNFTSQEEHWISGQNHSGADFVIVDEGPGRSGSTFLSVAEALVRCGVAQERITLMGSRQLDPASLLAKDAPARWTQFRFIAASSSVTSRFERDIYAGSGYWRTLLLAEHQDWPECWSQMERLKFISEDRRTLLKFEGMGRIGAEMRSRAFKLAEAGFSPPITDGGGGFFAYELLSGPVLKSSNLNPDLLDFMAKYCAFRADNFRAVGGGDRSQLKHMLEFNVLNEFGCAPFLHEDVFLTPNPVFVDGRMQPHEWVGTGSAGFLKTDAISHGDDHFFPGPCDITWDLAGIAVEWQLRAQEIDYLIMKFEKLCGITHTAKRLPVYMLAYLVFRLSFCKMANESVSESEEEARLRFAYRRYRVAAQELLRSEFRCDAT